MACNARSLRYHGYVDLFLLSCGWQTTVESGAEPTVALHPLLGVAKPTKLLEEAINSHDGDCAVRIIEAALGKEPDDVAH